MAIAPLVLGTLLGIGQAGLGLINRNKANAQENSAVRPSYKIPQEDFDSEALLASRAGQGLGDASLQYYNTNADRALTSTLNTILKSGGDPNMAGSAYTSYLDGMNRVAVANDAAQLNNIRLLVAQRQRLADQRDKAFQINEYAPYVDQLTAARQRGLAANNTIMSGISNAYTSLSGLAQNAGQQADVDTVKYGNNRTAVTDPIGSASNYPSIPYTPPPSPINPYLSNLRDDDREMLRGIYANIGGGFY